MCLYILDNLFWAERDTGTPFARSFGKSTSKETNQDPSPSLFFWETQERKILVFTTKWDPLVRSWFIIAFIDKYRLSINSNDPIYTWYTPHKSKVLLLVVSHGPHMAGEGQGKRQRGQHRGAGDGTTGVRGHSGDLSTGTMGTSADFTRDIIMLNCDSIDLMNIV